MTDADNSVETFGDDYDFLIKLLTLGNSSVGKTCLLHRYINQRYSGDFGNTVGVDFKQKKILYKSKDTKAVVGKEAKLNLQLWDTAGQERFRSLTVSFFRDAMGFMLVFDLTDEKSFLDLRDWVRLLKINAYCDSPDMVLVGNKCDLHNQRKVAKEDGHDLAKELNIPYIETSAYTGENVDDAFLLLVNLVMERINKTVDKSSLPVRRDRNSKLEKKTDEKKNCAC